MDFQAIVIGGGHAGIEAASALGRLGFATLLVTQSLDTIGRMSCNPAIGGLAKGNLVREVDALGGLMGRLADRTQIQFRMLNRSKGPAVQAPRAQADKAQYAAEAKHALERTPNLALFQDTVTDFLLEDGEIRGVLTERGRRFTAGAVVLTTGTFLEARLFIGEFSAPGGRLGEPPACGLGARLRELGFTVGRLKTGTPARALFSSIDLSRLELQEGDEEVVPFSFSGERIPRPSVPCHITYTTAETHRIIRENIHRSPLYSGRIQGVGPRYCPSIEDKVMRFPDRQRHQVFVEPEGLATEEAYLNGISSSLPEEVQEAFLRTVPGLENLVVVRPGYAVEYDYLEPTQLTPALQTKRIRGLFVAGQTNGTSGYEEAAAQGLMAGINAAQYLRGEEPLVLSRADAYIGVLIDDLVTLGTREPYRLFTSRAEYRLSLRHDTADLRLLPVGARIGLQDARALEALEGKRRGIAAVRGALRAASLPARQPPGGEPPAPGLRACESPARELGAQELGVQEPAAQELAAQELPPALCAHAGHSLEQALRDPRVRIQDLLPFCGELAGSPWLRLAELEVKYEGYIRRQEAQVERFRRLEGLRLPPGFDYAGTSGLSAEARDKLLAIRPVSLGQASRIAGVRSSDLAVLMIHLRKGG
jgi:tRNA uridine 5-carboxymethylaminomethyl modification enzyme